MIVRIIEDAPDLLVPYIPEGAPLGFVDGDWPTASGKHPWSNRTNWHGHGCLMLQRPEDEYAIWHFWTGPQRDFACWYINLQERFRRTPIGYDTQDLELDVVVQPDSSWELKDDELMDERVAEGRWTAEKVAGIRRLGQDICARLDRGERWWPQEYRNWKPDPSWVVPQGYPPGWESV